MEDYLTEYFKYNEERKYIQIENRRKGLPENQGVPPRMTPAEFKKSRQQPKLPKEKQPANRKSKTPEPIAKKKRAISDRDTETDDSTPPLYNPPSQDVILLSANNIAMDTSDSPELNTTDPEKLLQLYKINTSKRTKVEHHITFLEESLKQYKIPKGLQINKEYPVIDETEDFRSHIREIQMNAEIEIANTILTHYRTLFATLTKRTNLLSKRLKDLQPTTPELEKKTEEISKPIEALKNKLQQKRTTKLSNNKTHVERGEAYIARTKPSRSDPHQNRQQKQLRHQHPTNNNPPRYNHHSQRYRPPRERPHYSRYNPRRNCYGDQGMEEFITRRVQTLLTEMLPDYYLHQDWRNPYY